MALGTLYAFSALAIGGSLALSYIVARSTKSKWAKAASDLGMSQEHGPRWDRKIDGKRWGEIFALRKDGSELYVGIRHVGSGNSVVWHTYVEVYFAHSLELGLFVVAKKQGFFGKIIATKDILLNNKIADDALRIMGRDPDEVRALLLPKLCQDLIATMSNTVSATVRDLAVRLEISGERYVTADELRPFIDATENIAKQAMNTRSAMSANVHGDILSRTWSAAAAAHQFEYLAANHKMSRSTPKWRVTIRDVLHDQAWFTELVVELSTPLPEFELAIHGAGSKLKKLFGGQDIEVSSEIFNNLFLLKGPNESRIREILIDRAQDALVTMVTGMGDSLTSFACDQRGLTIKLSFSLTVGEHLMWTMSNLLAFTHALSQTDEMPSSGPFR